MNLRSIPWAAAFSLVLCACAGSPGFPHEAEAALRSYWESLPTDSSLTHKIIRAWPGDMTGERVPDGTEAWCVEAEISSPDPEIDGEPLVWLVVRTGSGAPWTAVLLAAMSSTWAYEACDQSIGSQPASSAET